MKKTIILRSSWQVVNIGDIAHTPGVLALLEKNLPDTEVILWASADLSQEVMDMEHRRFPNLKIVKGSIGEEGRASNDELQEALDKCDFLLHGSGPYLVAKHDVAAFVEHYKKPYGVFGITYNSDEFEKNILQLAKFIYFRDSVSLEKAKEDGINAPVMEFGPDGAFAIDLENELNAKAYLEENELEDGKFLCCIGRLRNTPYWTIRDVPKSQAAHDRNEEMKENDHKDLREAITEVVRKTDMKVLLCPEDMTQMAVNMEMIYEKLPEDVKLKVVCRDKFWLTDEAISVYRHSAGLFGNEMHSPIMCIGNGIPAIVCRWKEQTTKGFMWRDIGLSQWLFDMDKPEEQAKIAEAVYEIARNPKEAKEKALKAAEKVEKLQKEMCDSLKKSLNI